MPGVDKNEAKRRLIEAGFTVIEKRGHIKAYTDKQMVQFYLPITEKELSKHA